jgi:hypothetical protein
MDEGKYEITLIHLPMPFLIQRHDSISLLALYSLLADY